MLSPRAIFAQDPFRRVQDMRDPLLQVLQRLLMHIMCCSYPI